VDDRISFKTALRVSYGSPGSRFDVVAFRLGFLKRGTGELTN
jgi:hypothetical protein